jgi:hypothetical protein
MRTATDKLARSLLRRARERLTDALVQYENPKALGRRFRARRTGALLTMIEKAYQERGTVRVIDVGGVEAYWDILPPGFLEQHDVRVTIVNLPDATPPPARGRFVFVAGDACHLDMFADRQFDIAHSNSVIEHVGDWWRMTAFAAEIRRVAPRYFVQTPNYWFPVEPHFLAPFFHWVPRSFRVWLFHHVGAGIWGPRATREEAVQVVDSIHLLDRRALERLFGDARIVVERFCGLPKSLIAVRE